MGCGKSFQTSCTKDSNAPYSIYRRPKHDSVPIGSSLKPHQYEISKVHPSSKVAIPDLKLFENIEVIDDEDCEQTTDDEKEQMDNADNLQMITCPAMKRMVSVLNYYNALMLSGLDGLDEIATSKFIDFCDRHYGTKWILEDHIHCIAVHHDRDSMDKMAAALKWKCFDDLNRCEMTTRHYRDRSKRTAVHFYVDLMDSLHFNVLHLVDVGLRVNVDTNAPHEPDDNNLVDKTMLKMVRELRLKREQCSFDRLHDTSKSNKFSLCSAVNINATATAGQSTLDRVLNDFRRETKADTTATSLHTFLDQQQYDTDAVNNDMVLFADSMQCNTLKVLNGDIIKFNALRRILRYLRLSESSFSTGIWWAYWPWYRTQSIESMLKREDALRWQKIDFGGHSMKDLCVYPRFKNLKEEAMESGFISKRFMQMLLKKTDRYFNNSRCKKMVYGRDSLYFGISPTHSYLDILDSPAPRCHYTVSKDHILAMLLYTDSSSYCTALSETFRALEGGESIQDINSRNSNYYWSSMYLREMVECFGRYSCDDERPYYTGLSYEMHIPQFQLGLIGPTSTSMVREVAVIFAGEKGMILVLNGGFSPCFNAAWLSAYPEEQERIFCGSTKRNTLSTILFVNSAKNYHVAISAYSKFDAVFTGQMVRAEEQAWKEEVDIIMKSLQWINGGDDATNHQYLDLYILESFYSFVIHKTKVHLDFNNLYRIKDNNLCNMVVNTMWKGGNLEGYPPKWTPSEESGPMDANLLKPFVFELFPNIRQITMWNAVYPFDLILFLRLLQEVDLPEHLKVISIGAKPWIPLAYSERVKNEYAKANMNANLVEQSGGEWTLSIDI